ncbi:MAG: RIO1 family regulatory kinase/ATPase [Actinomycetota bacterium]
MTQTEPPALTSDFRDGIFAVDTTPDGPPEGDTWSSWDGAQHGPNPRPAWVITDLGAVDQDLGIIKSGKEADVHVVRRWVPGSDIGVHMAAKRFRDSDHRMFHRDAGYLEGRRVRRTRTMRAMARRTDFGKQMISSQWAFAEFSALGELWGAGLPVPYPVQINDTEVLMEFIGTQGRAAPRLAQTRPEPELLIDLFEQFRVTTSELARRGWAHGDLSPYNVLLHDDRLVIIDWPQIVDVIGNPRGPEFLHRDCHNMCAWFVSRGLAVDEEELFGDFMASAMSRW